MTLPAHIRVIHASGEIRRLTADIRYHDEEASRLRKERQKERSKLARAELSLQRDARSAAHTLQKGTE